MTDEINLDLSITTLARVCRGNVKLLPSFMVHDDPVWPSYSRSQLDSRNRIHMRRSTFFQIVPRQLPIRAGIWHGMNVREYHIDLQPHHLQGSADMPGRDGYTHSRAITLTDRYGRNPWDPDYGIDPLRPGPARQDPELAQIKLATDGPLRGVRSTLFDGPDTEGSALGVVSDD